MLLMSTSFSCSLYEFVSGMLLALLPALQASGLAVGLGTSKCGLEHMFMLLKCCMAPTCKWPMDLSEKCRQQDPTDRACSSGESA
jgi:hypothetical protein